jgi:hypothetical protein
MRKGGVAHQLATCLGYERQGQGICMPERIDNQGLGTAAVRSDCESSANNLVEGTRVARVLGSDHHVPMVMARLFLCRSVTPGFW